MTKESLIPQLVLSQKLPPLTSKTLLVLVSDLKALPSSIKGFSKTNAEIANRIESGIDLLGEPLKEGGCLQSPARSTSEPDLCVCILLKQTDAFSMQQWARDRLRSCFRVQHQEIVFVFQDRKHEEALVYSFSLALGARLHFMPAYGKKLIERKSFKLKTVVLVGVGKNSRDIWQRGQDEIWGTNLVRTLGFMPPNELNPGLYGKKIQALCKENGLSLKFHSNAQLKKMGANAFVAVDRGDPDSEGGIWEIDYSPKAAKNKKHLALVGKGLCFDTGGYDIKVGGGMYTMKGDMQGSAVALATIIVAKRTKLPLRMKAFLAVTENHISPKAYKADEVITALNGVTIEVVNTDAEGRMVLADTLAIASDSKAELIMDFATLTGAAVRAIGTSYSAVFTNNDGYHQRIIAAGKESGERVWTFPLDSDFGKHLDSTIADTLQCSKAVGIDHILAAYFLNRFVKEGIDWVHVDLACAENKGGLGPVDSEYTGFGVRFALQFLRSHYKIAS